MFQCVGIVSVIVGFLLMHTIIYNFSHFQQSIRLLSISIGGAITLTQTLTLILNIIRYTQLIYYLLFMFPHGNRCVRVCVRVCV